MRLLPLGLLALIAFPHADYVTPDVPDLTITTRTVFEDSLSPMAMVLRVRLKGARQIYEQTIEPSHGAAELSYASVSQCDARRTLFLNHVARTYSYSPMDDPRMLQIARRGGTPVRRIDDSEAQAVMTIDAVDTGGRRAFGPLTARHVITTTTIEATDASSPRKSTEIEDGWYVDLPPGDCQDWGERTMLAVGTRGGDAPPTFRIVRKGSARRGFPLIETRRVGPDGERVMNRIELVAVSAAPLDPALFDVPAGYRPALRLLDGGIDTSRPDTLLNRAGLVWDAVTGWVRWLVR
jgi:hypothetical protein